MKDILHDRKFYKPFCYPEFYNYWTIQQSMFWLPFEIPMDRDVQDFNNVLSDDERKIFHMVLRFFTQVEVEVSAGYIDLMKYFPLYEIKSMISSFLNMETIHAASYSHLISSLNLPEEIFKEFLDYKVMKDKVDMYLNIKPTSPLTALKLIACISIFTEGFILYSSFYILISLSQVGLMSGVSQIATFAMRDETLHNAAMTHLYKNFRKYIIHYEINTEAEIEEMENEIKQMALKFIDLEIQFVNLIFDNGKKRLRNLEMFQVIEFIWYLAEKRMNQIGYSENYQEHYDTKNFADFLLIINSKENTDFFNQKPTTYHKNTKNENMF
ncbi:Ribonucleoside-diphosphate reductase subunit beta [bacterium AB1]|nr:Ribonucleoside-diphosphate reductase subunit beta [bacterium AB1]